MSAARDSGAQWYAAGPWLIPGLPRFTTDAVATIFSAQIWDPLYSPPTVTGPTIRVTLLCAGLYS